MVESLRSIIFQK